MVKAIAAAIAAIAQLLLKAFEGFYESWGSPSAKCRTLAKEIADLEAKRRELWRKRASLYNAEHLDVTVWLKLCGDIREIDSRLRNLHEQREALGC